MDRHTGKAPERARTIETVQNAERRTERTNVRASPPPGTRPRAQRRSSAAARLEALHIRLGKNEERGCAWEVGRACERARASTC